MFRPRRQHRYTVLRESGFLPFEASELSKVPFKTPYMRDLIRARRKQVWQMIKEKRTKKSIRFSILNYYIESNWRYKDGKRRRNTTLSPWELLRTYEERYQDKQPDYRTPQKKRKRKHREFSKKARESLGKRGLEL